MAYGKTLLDRLVVELSANADLRGIKNFDRAAEQLVDTLDRAGRVAQGIGAAASAAVAIAVAAFSGVEARLAEVAAKTGISMEVIRADYFDALRAIQRETGRGDAELYGALQRALSAGLEGDAAIDAVGAAARAAAARIGDISDQVSAATTLMGAFDVAAGTALDTVARAAQVGEGDTEDFASSLKGIGALGESVGLGLYDVAGGLAAISRSAKSVSEGETMFKAFIGALSGKSRVGAELLKEFELSFEQLRKIGEDQGLAAVVGTLKSAVGDDIEKLNRILGSSEALQFVLNVDASQLAALTSDIERTAPGTISRAFAEGAELSVRKLEQFREGVRNVFEDIGQFIDPLAGWILDIGIKLTDAFAALPDGLKRATSYGTLLLAALLPLGTVVRVLAGLRGTTALLSRSLARAAGEAAAAGEGLAGTGKAAKGLKGRLAGLSRFLPLVLNPATLVLAGIATLAIVIAKWDEIKSGIRSAGLAVREFFSAEGVQSRETDRRLEAQSAMVGALEEQRRILEEQGAPAERIAAAEERIAEAKRRQAELERRQQAHTAFSELRKAREVALPGLQDQLSSLEGERARLRNQLDSGFTPGNIAGFGPQRIPLTDEKQTELQARLVTISNERAGVQSQMETLTMTMDVNIGHVMAINDDDLTRAAVGTYRTFGRSLREGGSDLGQDVGAMMESAFSPYLPDSDAEKGPLSRLTAAGRAIPETIAKGIRQGDPIAVALAGIAMTFPLPDPLEQTVEQVVEQVAGAESDQVAMARVFQIVERVVEPFAAPEAETLFQRIEQVVVPVAARVSEYLAMADEHQNAAATGGAILSFHPIPPPDPATPQVGVAGGSRHFEMRIERIEINAPGADAQEIARGIRHSTRNEWRTLVEEADSQIDS